MAATKRTDFQRNENYIQITEWYLRGKHQSEIAALLGLSQGMISNDLKEIQRRWRESTTMNLDEAKARELARLDQLEREFWTAWEASKNERTQARQEKNNAGATVKASMMKEQRDGNPSFLQGVLNCIDRRCKLLGLDAPTKQEVAGPGGGPIQTEQSTKPDLSKLSLEELLNLRQMMSKASDGITEST